MKCATCPCAGARRPLTVPLKNVTIPLPIAHGLGTITTRSMTILEYITPSRVGGAETYFLRMARFLETRGHKVITVSKTNSPLAPRLKAELSDVRLWKTFGKFDLASVARLGHLLQEEKVDLLHAHLSTAWLIGGLAGRLAGVPVVSRVPATNHSTFLRFAHRLTAVSHGVKDYLVGHGVPDEKVVVLYNGVDLARFECAPERETARKALGLPTQAFVVMCAASLVSRKGHLYLLRAAAHLTARGQRCEVLLSGEGEEEPVLRAEAERLGLTPRVRFLGYQRDVVPIMAAADVVVLPSFKEGLPNVLVEAMAMRRPVVATSIPGVVELVIPGVNGFLVPPGDAMALADALLRLRADPSLRRQMGNTGREGVARKFDQRHCLAEVEDFLVGMGSLGRAPRTRASWAPREVITRWS